MIPLTAIFMKFSKQQTNYVSEITRFIADLKKQDPALEDKQRAGRALLWDREPIDLDNTRRAQESRVQQKSYVYQSK